MAAYYGWKVVAAAIFFQAITSGFFIYSFTLWVKPWATEFGAEVSQVMLAIVLGTLIYSALAPFVGRAIDRWPIRMLVSVGAVLLALGYVLVAFTTALVQIIVLYATLMAAGGMLSGSLPAQSLAVKWFRARRGLALGVVSLGGSIGGLLGPPFTAFILDEFGWRQAHLILAAIIVVGVVPLTWLTVANSPGDKGVEPEPDSARTAAASLAMDRDWTVPAILREKAFWITAICFVPLMTGFGAVQQNLGPYAADLGINPMATSLMLSVIAAGAIGGKLIFGALADRMDHRLVYWIAAAIYALGVLAMLDRPSLARITFGSALLGFSSGAGLPIMGAILGARFGPRTFGQVMGLVGMLMVLSTLGPVILARTRELTGSYDAAFLALLALLAPAAALMALLPATAAKLAADRAKALTSEARGS